MSQRIDKLPEGLRPDDDLTNGIVVGRQWQELDFGCTREFSKEDVVLGGCESERIPDKAWIDDTGGSVYLPLKAGFLRLGKEDGIRNGHSFGKRFFGKMDLWAYLFKGPSVLQRDGDIVLMKNNNLWVTAAVLDHFAGGGKAKAEFVLEAARLWAFHVNPSPYRDQAREEILKLAENPEVPYRVRVESALHAVEIEGGSGASLQRLRALATDMSVPAEERMQTIRQLLFTKINRGDFWHMILDLGWEARLAFIGDERNPAALRLRLAEDWQILANGGRSYNFMLSDVLFGLAVDQRVEKAIRLKAALLSTEGGRSETREEAGNLIFSLLEDPNIDAEVRLSVLGGLPSYERAREAMDLLLAIARDDSVDPAVRVDALQDAARRIPTVWTGDREIERKQELKKIVTEILHFAFQPLDEKTRQKAFQTALSISGNSYSLMETVWERAALLLADRNLSEEWRNEILDRALDLMLSYSLSRKIMETQVLAVLSDPRETLAFRVAAAGRLLRSAVWDKSSNNRERLFVVLKGLGAEAIEEGATQRELCTEIFRALLAYFPHQQQSKRETLKQLLDCQTYAAGEKVFLHPEALEDEALLKGALTVMHESGQMEVGDLVEQMRSPWPGWYSDDAEKIRVRRLALLRDSLSFLDLRGKSRVDRALETYSPTHRTPPSASPGNALVVRVRN